MITELLRLRGNSKSIAIALLVREPGAQDHRRAPLFLLLSRVLKIVIVRRSSY
jgi:hypothetical protein